MQGLGENFLHKSRRYKQMKEASATNKENKKGEQLEKEMFRDDFDEENSEDDERNSNIEINFNLSDLVVGDFVLVNYEEELFPGHVLKKDYGAATFTCIMYTPDEIVKRNIFRSRT